MRLARGGSRLDPAGLRLPLIALIDVCLFLLIYFIIAGSLVPEEGQLGTQLRTESRAASSTPGFQPQVIHVEQREGRPAYRLGDRVCWTREDLEASLRPLPKDIGVIVRVSGETTVDAAAAAVQACRDAGFAQIKYLGAR